jgi:hypothetical protein
MSSCYAWGKPESDRHLQTSTPCNPCLSQLGYSTAGGVTRTGLRAFASARGLPRKRGGAGCAGSGLLLVSGRKRGRGKAHNVDRRDRVFNTPRLIAWTGPLISGWLTSEAGGFS